MVDRILDVVEERADAVDAGVPGTAVIAGRATELLDAACWLDQAAA